MKPIIYLTGLTTFVLAATVSADVTVTLTGATAFRSAALNTIKAKFAAGNGTVSYKYAHDAAAGSFTGSTRSLWIGNFPGITGTTTIRCCFTGSVEGIRAVSQVPGILAGQDSAAPTYYDSSILGSTTASAAGTELASAGSTAAALTTTSDIAFSDVNKTSTPYASASLGTDTAGVIVFTMMANEGSVINNVTSQQYRALLTQGYQPLSLFTGNVADSTLVFPIGRNDGSGTRTTALAETGYGITKTVNQYVTASTSGNTITSLKLVPVGGATASSVWGQDVDGNGGYESGGKVVAPMGLTTASVQVFGSDGTTVLLPAAHVDLVTWLGVGDASTAKNNGAVVCAYNGVSLDLGNITTSTKNATTMTVGTRYTILTTGSTDYTICGAANNAVGTVFTATAAGLGSGTVTLTSYTLSTSDIAKVQNGSYTAWGFERMFRTNTVTGDKLTVYNGILGTLPSNLGTAGIAISTMTVSRDTDGGVVFPIN